MNGNWSFAAIGARIALGNEAEESDGVRDYRGRPA
jgi:hypothetical protein